MSSAHEVITLQIGNYANFIGSHWWNIQESSFCYSENVDKPLDICHDVLFREGLNSQHEVTFTPRLISIDLKPNLRTLKKESALYESTSEENVLLWDGSSTTVKQDEIEKNAFLKSLDGNLDSEVAFNKQHEDLTNVVQSWSDYLKPHFHPRSICLIDEYYMTGGSFTAYGAGLEAYSNKATKDMIEDHLRQFVEECDYLQGFHILADGDNGFTAVASCLLQHLDDEYQRKVKVAFPVFASDAKPESTEEAKDLMLQSLYSTVIGFDHYNEFTSCFSPLSVCDLVSRDKKYFQYPHIDYKPESKYHSSAILAAALDSLSAPYRLKQRKFLLNDIVENIILYGRKLVSSGLCLPFPIGENESFKSVLDKLSDNYSMQPVTPHFDPRGSKSLAQFAVLRGIPEKRFESSKTSPYDNTDSESLFGRYLCTNSPSSLTFMSVFEEPFSIPISYPNFFTHRRHSDTTSTAVAATLSNSNDALKILESLLDGTKKQYVQMQIRNMMSQVERDDFGEVIHQLTTMKENYGPDFCV